jgi:hypothetical protein
MRDLVAEFLGLHAKKEGWVGEVTRELDLEGGFGRVEVSQVVYELFV